MISKINFKSLHMPIEKTTDNLTESAKRELKKLKKASQDIETHFIKELLKNINYVGLNGKKGGAMGDYAMDTYKQSLAESIAKTQTLGFSDQIYSVYAESIIRQDVAKQLAEHESNKNKKESI